AKIQFADQQTRLHRCLGRIESIRKFVNWPWANLIERKCFHLAILKTGERYKAHSLRHSCPLIVLRMNVAGQKKRWRNMVLWPERRQRSSYTPMLLDELLTP